MPMEEQHIVTAFDRDLQQIESQLMEMGGLVELAIKQSVDALRKQDTKLAETVVKRDKKIDALDETLNEHCARIIALRQPAASDLRLVLSVMRITHNLERIGDYAKNIAKRTIHLSKIDHVNGTNTMIAKMAGEVHLMLTDVLDAYVRQDVDLAEQVRQRDLDVDQLYNAFFRELLTFMMEDPRIITACMHLHFVAKNIERMGDHITAIAEQITYMISGDVPTDKRPTASNI